MSKKKGSYLGTEIDKKWWKRYRKKPFFARGSGTYWHDEEGLCFLRYLTKEPIKIPYKRITGCELGKWHSGKWCMGHEIVKIIWADDDQLLSSGFFISKQAKEVEQFIADIKARI